MIKQIIDFAGIFFFVILIHEMGHYFAVWSIIHKQPECVFGVVLPRGMSKTDKDVVCLSGILVGFITLIIILLSCFGQEDFFTLYMSIGCVLYVAGCKNDLKKMFMKN